MKAISLLLMSFALVVSAQTNPSPVRPLSLQDCIALALEHNLDVRISRYNPEVERARAGALYGAYDPELLFQAVTGLSSRESTFDPGLGVTNITSESRTRSGTSGLSGLLPTGMRYDISATARRTSERSLGGEQYDGGVALTARQPLLRDFWIDGTRQAILVSRKNISISELGFQFQVMRTVTAVQLAYYDLIFARENVKVQEKALQLADRLLAENKKRVEVGALAPLDEKQAEAQAATSRADMLAAQRELAVRENTLRRLITDDFMSWAYAELTPTDSLLAIAETPDRIESWRRGLMTRPDLIQFQQELEKQDIVLRYQQNQLFPALDLFGSFGYNGVDADRNNAALANFDGVVDDIVEQNNPAYRFGIELRFPLGNRTARNRLLATKAEKAQALLQLKRLEQDIMVEIDDAIKLVGTNYERVDATRQARLFAEAALDAEQKKLENGKSTSFIVLQIQRDLTAARSAEIRALAEYNKARAALALSEGSTLERTGVDVQPK